MLTAGKPLLCEVNEKLELLPQLATLILHYNRGTNTLSLNYKPY